MIDSRTFSEYREALEALLADPASPLTDDDVAALRAIVRERRNGRNGQALTQSTKRIHRQADAIVELLGSAARDLRPRETQELEDIVAGRAPATPPPARSPIRSHRSGWPSR
jgi:hypothetical protein